MDRIGDAISQVAAQWSRTNDLIEDCIPTWAAMIQQLIETTDQMRQKLKKLEEED